MRKSPVLDALFSRTKQQILAAALLQPGHAWYLLELSRHLRVTPSSLQRELKALSEAGILKRQQNGGRVYFQADASCPIFQELTQILFKTAGVVEALRRAFRPIQDGIKVAFVFGSIAVSKERSTSDVDVLIVGSTPLSAVAPILRDAEKSLGRPVNPHVYSAAEFTERLGRRDHFLSSVLQEKRLFILGDENELAELAAGAKTKAAPHQSSRDQRSEKPG